MFRGIAEAQRYRQKNANGGEIGVTVGESGVANFDQADDWEQRSQKPKPADGEIGKLLSRPPGGHRNAGQNQERRGSVGRGNGLGQRIKDRQMRGPKKILQIERICDGNVFEAQRQRNLRKRFDRAAVALRQKSDGAGSGGQDKKRNFFQEQRK